MIAKAGLLVQIDDAWLPALWDRIGVQMGLAAYQRYCMHSNDNRSAPAAATNSAALTKMNATGT